MSDFETVHDAVNEEARDDWLRERPDDFLPGELATAAYARRFRADDLSRVERLNDEGWGWDE